MDLLLAATTDPGLLTLVLLAIAVALALGFEFVNGFHDTANAVATVIYTNTLKPTPAVVWSGIWNLIGVLTSSGAVAFGIVSLLPVELVLNVGTTAGFAMVFSILMSAIAWNLGTWWLGLPASSSHTLIGSILGVGIANSLMGTTHSVTDGVNWSKAKEVMLGLLISPALGFAIAALLLILLKVALRNPALFRAPEPGKKPPGWIRGILMTTCTGVSFAHGSNDGQKGMGLVVLILVGLLPGTYALNLSADRSAITGLVQESTQLATTFRGHAVGDPMPQPEATRTLSEYLKPLAETSPQTFAALATTCDAITAQLQPLQTLADLHPTNRARLRTDLYLVSKAIRRLDSEGHRQGVSPIHDIERRFASHAEALTQFIPKWVQVSVALALGLGTMIGYRRIVRTVGEKIGKDHLTYAQGASAEAVAMAAILTGDHLALPVSTTHVLSSGIAGTMAANASGLQTGTVRNILLAWVLTLPVCVFLGALLFAASLNLGVLVFGG
jgi:PiT family inorganic phosphate transporter